MEKILVTTDFSANSKAALRFAFQLATQKKFELTFFHSFYVLIPTGWNKNKISEYKKIEEKKIQNKLNRFVAAIYKNTGIDSLKFECVTKSSAFTENNIRKYAEENRFSFICMGTRGVGKFKRLFGTTTAKLIKQSRIPILAVPGNYRSNSISSILYASDLLNIEKELKKVIDFARPLNAQVVLLHFSPPYKFVDSKMFETRVKNISRYENIDVHIENETHDKPGISIITSILKKTKSSMMIMFTEQQRNLFQKIFLSSKSVNHSFKTEVPLLVYNKA
ncbi:MAG TPA: universal stress protein [Chitinophagaceae bacterium]|jgi:nucleotide-binding universal stress UspA family protein|nr:universal stress protein [Chitinophagaceae bacterium]